MCAPGELLTCREACPLVPENNVFHSHHGWTEVKAAEVYRASPSQQAQPTRLSESRHHAEGTLFRPLPSTPAAGVSPGSLRPGAQGRTVSGPGPLPPQGHGGPGASWPERHYVRHVRASDGLGFCAHSVWSVITGKSGRGWQESGLVQLSQTVRRRLRQARGLLAQRPSVGRQDPVRRTRSRGSRNRGGRGSELNRFCSEGAAGGDEEELAPAGDYSPLWPLLVTLRLLPLNVRASGTLGPKQGQRQGRVTTPER